MKMKQAFLVVPALALSLGATACSSSPDVEAEELDTASAEHKFGKHKKNKKYNSGSYNLHLEDRVRFKPLEPGADVAAGRALFGLDAVDDNLGDNSGALFEGFSVAAQQNIVSNGRSCFTCHRGADINFGLGNDLPLSNWIDPTDPLFTGVDADAQGDPDGLSNLDNLALFKYRPNRFNLFRPQSDPYRRVFFWRKSPTLVNIAFNTSFLNDGRGRVMLETDRGAILSHTQEEDIRFDDLFSAQNAADMEAFQFSLVTDPVLLALRDPSDPMHDTLVNDPFYTVPAQTWAQKKGQKVFEKYCFSCHNMPNVFGALDNVEPLGPDNAVRGADFPAWGPSTSRTYNIGVSEENKHGLRFTEITPGGEQTVVIPLAAEDGSQVDFPVTFDIGLAASTGRFEDVGRFKVPQLRDLANNAPYFHDNSAMTIEEVVEYFDSPAYNQSADGKKHKINMSKKQKEDLVEFLKIL